VVVPPAPVPRPASRSWRMTRIFLSGLAVLAVAGAVAAPPAQAAWGVKAWTGDPSEAPQLPLASPSGDGSGPDITLPPGYGAPKPAATDAVTAPDAGPAQGYAAPAGTNFSFGSSLAGALTCQTHTTSCAMSAVRTAGAACYCTDSLGNRSWGTAR
jgi:hypothetical protein